MLGLKPLEVPGNDKADTEAKPKADSEVFVLTRNITQDVTCFNSLRTF